jgi:hypothetical protein
MASKIRRGSYDDGGGLLNGHWRGHAGPD